MKNSIKALLLPLLIAATAVFSAGCTDEGGNGAVTAPDSVAAASQEEISSGEALDGEQYEVPVETEKQGGEAEDSQTQNNNADSLWTNAKYTEDAEVGDGEITLNVKVATDEKTITITVHTDTDNLGAALLENELADGEQSEYGLYIKLVNGIEADYDKNQAWWAISKDGEMLMTGADSTPIANNENYELTYTKG